MPAFAVRAIRCRRLPFEFTQNVLHSARRRRSRRRTNRVAKHLVPFLPAAASLNPDAELNKRVGPVAQALTEAQAF